ncbi:transposase [Lancefieldella rimae]|uniref:transposase n=1 Tax=Lancefieldella rimae TaxID=1383 RepID=UPI0037C0F10E
MDLQADELQLPGEGNRRCGYRIRTLHTCMRILTLRIPKLREGTYFPDEILKPYLRDDRAMVLPWLKPISLVHQKVR